MKKLIILIIFVIAFSISFRANSSNKCFFNMDTYNNYDLDYCIEIAKSGNVDILHSLGLVYLQGANKNPSINFSLNENKKKLPIIEIDYVKSFFWFNEAVKNNDTESMLWLASSYLSGKGTLEDLDKSFYYINLAAKNDSVNAKLILAAIYGSSSNINRLLGDFSNLFNRKKFNDPIKKYGLSLTSLYFYLLDKFDNPSKEKYNQISKIKFADMTSEDHAFMNEYRAKYLSISIDYVKSSNIYKKILYNEKNINTPLSKFIIKKLLELNLYNRNYYEHYIWGSIYKAISANDPLISIDIKESKKTLSNDEIVIANKYILTFLEKGFPEYEIQEILKEKIIVINEKQENGSFKVSSTGSGFYINKIGHIITNNHVTKSCKKLSIVHLNKRLEGQVKVFDENLDVSIIETDTESNSSALFREKDIELGENVMVVGFPLQGILSSSANVTTGIISATRGIQDDEKFYQISAPIQSGNSGGAVLDEYGFVIGIVVSKLNSIKLMNISGEIPQNVNFAIQKNKIINFLKKNKIKFSTSSELNKISTVLRAGRGEAISVMVECWN